MKLALEGLGAIVVREFVETSSAMTDPERRKSARQRVFLGAIARAHHGMGSFDCMVRNLSADGARIECDGAAQFPHAFALDVTARGIRRQAHVVWRSENMLGLAFDEGGQAAILPSGVVSLAGEREKLRRQVGNATW